MKGNGPRQDRPRSEDTKKPPSRSSPEPESPATREIRSQERVRWGFHVAVCVLVLFGLIALGRATVREGELVPFGVLVIDQHVE